MNCREIKKYLPLYPDDAAPAIREEIERHLQRCAECKVISERLDLYRSYAESAEAPEMPENFDINVIRKLGNDLQAGRSRQLTMKYALFIGSAAAIIILFLLFRPEDKPWEGAIETSFALKKENKGKGPSELINFNKIDESILKLIAETGSTVEVRDINPVTGYYDYIVLGVPLINLPEFIGKFNEVSAIPLNMPGKGGENMAINYFKIYFDMINFTTGNFDGDGYADLIVQFISGMHKGKWAIYHNHDSLHFTEHYFLDVGKDEAKYLGDYRMLSGDFNGDGLDDIYLYEYSDLRGFSSHLLLNEKDYRFRKADIDFMKLSFRGNGKFVKIMPGDADGNGIDDLLRIAAIEKDSFEIATMNAGIAFSPLKIPDFDSCAAVLLGGDMNGDNYADICVKYMAGERAGQTWIYLNTRSYSFDEPYYGGLSWAGDYIFLTGDYNGDGLDDLFVKSGGPFIPGEWYVMRNQRSGGLIFEKQFQLELPGD